MYSDQNYDSIKFDLWPNKNLETSIREYSLYDFKNVVASAARVRFCEIIWSNKLPGIDVFRAL